MNPVTNLSTTSCAQPHLPYIYSFSRALTKGSRLLAAATRPNFMSWSASAIRWTLPCDIISGFVSSLATLSCRSIGPHGLRIAGLMDSETVRDILTTFFQMGWFNRQLVSYVISNIHQPNWLAVCMCFFMRKFIPNVNAHSDIAILFFSE